MPRVTGLAITLLLTAAAVTHAQVPTMPAPLCATAAQLAGLTGTDLDQLTTAYNAGDWATLQTKARALIDAAKRAIIDARQCPDNKPLPTDIGQLLNYSRNYVALVWIGLDPLTANATYMRVVVHGGAASATPFALDVPGIAAKNGQPTLAEVFVARSADAKMTTLYTSTHEDNPIAADLPASIQAIAGPLFSTIGLVAPAIPSARARVAAPAPTPIYASVSRVGLPFERASIHLTGKAKDAVDLQSFLDALSQLPTTLRSKETAYSACGQQYAGQLESEIENALTAEAACGSAKPDALACQKALDMRHEQLYASAIGGKFGCSKNDDADTLRVVDQKFRDFVASSGSASAAADVTFHNRPRTHFALGAGSAVIATGTLSRPRVKLDNGTITADPLPRVMTMAFVNASPAGYDPATPSMSRAERTRLFFGASLTPDFGVVGGLNVLLVRGIGIAAGGGVLFGTGADADAIGKAPADATDPFQLAIGKVAFVGITYNYK